MACLASGAFAGAAGFPFFFEIVCKISKKVVRVD